MARRRKRLLGRLAVAVGLAAVVSNLEKEAKEEGKDITDVAVDKVNTFVDSVKSGELQKNVLEKADKLINSTKESVNNAVETVKSADIKEKVVEMADNLKDGVVDIIDGAGTNAPEDGTAEVDIASDTEEE